MRRLPVLGLPPTGCCELHNASTIADDMSFILCTRVSVCFLVDSACSEIDWQMEFSNRSTRLATLVSVVCKAAIFLQFDYHSNSQLLLYRNLRIQRVSNAVYRVSAFFFILESCGLLRVHVLFAKFPRFHGHARLHTSSLCICIFAKQKVCFRESKSPAIN